MSAQLENNRRFSTSRLPEGLADCEGLPREKWVTKAVLLQSDDGTEVGKGLCQNISSDLVVGCDGPLGDHRVAIQVVETFNESIMPFDSMFSLRPWDITRVFYNGWSLHDHEQRSLYNKAVKEVTSRKRKGTRPYEYTTRKESVPRQSRGDARMSLESINMVAAQMCCARNCVQPFPRAKILAVRKQYYQGSDWMLKRHIMLDVHRQVHVNNEGFRVVTLEGVDVCPRAWYLIYGIGKTSFHRNAEAAEHGARANDHGNSGTKKTRTHTVQATATLRCLVENIADQMPYKSTTLDTGEKVVSMQLPPSFKWKETLQEVNEVNELMGIGRVSASGLSLIRKTSFAEYAKKKPGDNFARCGTCDKLKGYRSAATKGTRSWDIWNLQLNAHLASQRAHRELYYANRYHSISYPDKVVTVIHDKMDHSKTASLVYSHKSKQIDSYMRLPIAVTGMIAHGHGDYRYAHYGIDIYPHDSNHTIGSIAKLLWDLERPPMYSSRVLFQGGRSSPIFDAILKGSEICESSLLPEPCEHVSAKQLPPVLHIQLDNAASDNKNRFVLCYFSLLVAECIFREVHVNFMLVGHTHDDIDALFGQWAMKLRQSDYPTIPLLMKSFMDVDKVPVVPHLVEEVSNFKGFIAPFIASDDESLEGHASAQQFKFYKHSSGWPMMQYKISCTDSDWLPRDGGIKLWKEDSYGKPLLPHGEPRALAPHQMKNFDEVVKGLGSFITLWEMMGASDPSGQYRRKHEQLVYYWKGVRDALTQPMAPEAHLKNGFWPTSRVTASLEDHFEEDGALREEFAQDAPYVGQRRNRPSESFRVARDVYAGYFIAVRPADRDCRPFWLARALTDPNADRNHPNEIQVEFWTPCSKNSKFESTYIGWDTRKSLQWERDSSQGPTWVSTDCIMTSWMSSIQEDSRNPKIKIPANQVPIINASIEVMGVDIEAEKDSE